MRYSFLPALILLTHLNCSQPASQSDYVIVQNGQFYRNGVPYLFMGANYWQGMNLASSLTGGDIHRMKRDLDKMKSLGITNLRILAISEGPHTQPYRVLPAVQEDVNQINDTLWTGLDLLLSEMKKRNMTATLVLNNFWPWSGGMPQYVKWFSGDSIPYPPPHPSGNWDVYQKFTARFYALPRATEHFRSTVRKLIERVNSVTAVEYKNDPTILSWELANEPRGMDHVTEMLDWIRQTSEWIKSIDPNHLITTGAEGYTADPTYTGTDFIKMHSFPAIDYATAHIWIQNWGWYDPLKHDSTYPTALQKMKNYLRQHAHQADSLGKPFVLEEFGIMKDDGRFDPSATNVHRDLFYADVFEEIYQLATQKKAAGTNFWAWSGEGLPRIPGKLWNYGDPLTGDPPHEPQGWYSVYSSDTSTHQVIRTYAKKMTLLGRK